MSEQQPTGGSEKTVQRTRPPRRRTVGVFGCAALINECGNFVAQLDAHPAGAAIALAAVCVAVVALAVTLHATRTSRACPSTGSTRGRRGGIGRKKASSETRRVRQ